MSTGVTIHYIDGVDIIVKKVKNSKTGAVHRSLTVYARQNNRKGLELTCFLLNEDAAKKLASKFNTEIQDITVEG